MPLENRQHLQTIKMSKNELYKKGDVIGGKFEVHNTLGEGGCGVVYLVYPLERNVVLALFLPAIYRKTV